MESGKQELKIKFAKAQDYRIVGATGAWGGPTPNGEILAEFYVEYKDTPEAIQLAIETDGSTREVGRSESGYITRELQLGILMRPDIARKVGEWLIKHADSIMNPNLTLNS